MSETTKTPDDQIAENLANPRVVQTDDMRVEQHSLKDQAAAADYLARRDRTKNRKTPFRLYRLLPYVK